MCLKCYMYVCYSACRSAHWVVWICLKWDMHVLLLSVYIDAGSTGSIIYACMYACMHTFCIYVYNAVTNIFDKIVLLVKSTLLYSRILVILVILS